MPVLEIKNLHVSVETENGSKEILRGVDLTIRSGETHAIMGPNGSGKSTLAYSIAGHPKYAVTAGEILLDSENVLEMSPDERAREHGRINQQRGRLATEQQHGRPQKADTGDDIIKRAAQCQEVSAAARQPHGKAVVIVIAPVECG